VSDLHACVGFRGSKKVEKHWPIDTTKPQHLAISRCRNCKTCTTCRFTNMLTAIRRNYYRISA